MNEIRYRNKHCLKWSLQEHESRGKSATQQQQKTPDQSQQPSLGSHLDPSTPSTPPAPTTPPKLGRTSSGNKSKVSSARRIKRYSTGEEGGAPSGVARTSSGVYDRRKNRSAPGPSYHTIRLSSSHAHTHTCIHNMHAQSRPTHRKSPFLQRSWDTPSATPSLFVEVCIIFSLLPTTAGSHHSPTLFFLDHKSKNRNSSLRISRGKGEGEMAATKKLANKR